MGTGSYPAGILINETGDLYVSHYFGNFKVYDKNFELVRETKVPSEPKQLALGPCGELAIAFPTRIGIFDPVSCEPVRYFGDRILRGSRGIAIEDDIVYASCSASNKVHVFGFNDGELKATYGPGLKLSTLDCCSHLRQPCGMAVLDGRILAVADRGNNRIVLLDKETFELVSQIPTAVGAADHCLLKCPNDVKVDSGGNLLVMDTGNERIVVFREDGSMVASILQGFFKYHGGTFCNLCYNHITGAIAASNDDAHCITVLSPIFASFGTDADVVDATCIQQAGSEQEEEGSLPGGIA